MRIALDFGTTNTLLVQRQPDGSIVSLPLAGLIDPAEGTIPSLLYVTDGGHIAAGHAVHAHPPTERLFRNFKRGILNPASHPPVLLDGVRWDAHKVGAEFLRAVFRSLPADIDTLAMSVPVTAFQAYVDWLKTVLVDFVPDQIQVVDESTAAALGYALTEPGALVLVFDFGGGTLDLSLVKLPDSREQTGGILSRLWRGGSRGQAAQVIAKAGRTLGGSDVDQWLAEWVGVQMAVAHDAALLMACEAAKKRLSTLEATTIPTPQGDLSISRADLEAVLTAQGFYIALRRAVDKLMHTARQRGIFREDIAHVLMVGGMSFMPSVQAFLRGYFSEGRVHTDKPFSAVAEGALLLTEGGGLDDYLIHSYGLRYLAEGGQRFDEILPMGTPIPTDKPIEVVLQAAHADQAELEFVIGQIDPDAAPHIDVRHEDGRAVIVAQDSAESVQVVALNGESPLVVRLQPSGVIGVDRVGAAFRVDESRQLRVTVTDLKRHKTLIRDAVLATIR